MIGQAINIYEADELMENLYDIITATEPLKQDDPLQTHSSLSTRYLSSGLTLQQWLYPKLKSSNSREQKLAQFFIQFLRKGLFIDIQGLPENYKYYFNNQDVSSSSLAGSAYVEGILISLKKAPDFEPEYIEVIFQ